MNYREQFEKETNERYTEKQESRYSLWLEAKLKAVEETNDELQDIKERRNCRHIPKWFPQIAEYYCGKCRNIVNNPKTT